MPITPFHFGPGFFIKSIFSRWFSFRVFILANVVTDFETLYFILQNQWPLHRFCHTYLGAIIIAIFVSIIARPICYSATHLWNVIFKNLKAANNKIPIKTVIISAFAGTLSHVLLDSIMHKDMAPWQPFNDNNSMLHVLTYEQLHLFCIILGVLGVIIYFYSIKRKEKGPNPLKGQIK